MPLKTARYWTEKELKKKQKNNWIKKKQPSEILKNY